MIQPFLQAIKSHFNARKKWPKSGNKTFLGYFSCFFPSILISRWLFHWNMLLKWVNIERNSRLNGT